MALINFARREIEVKIVFYGPAFSGKTTNVEVLHRLMPPAQRGELHSLRTEQDRTLFFDYVPVRLGEIAGFTARFKLFTVPGQPLYKETRRVLLQGADAVVFVADSSPDRMLANSDALIDLETNLTAHGLDLHSIPLVIQLNKRDVAGALSLEALAELNPFEVPVIEAVAAEGRGVLDTLRRVTDIAANRIRENLAGQATAVQLTAVERPEAEDDRNVVREQLEHIRHVRVRENAAFAAQRRAGAVDARDVDAVLSELVVRSEDVTPPEPIPPMDGPLDELPVPGDDARHRPRPYGFGALGQPSSGHGGGHGMGGGLSGIGGGSLGNGGIGAAGPRGLGGEITPARGAPAPRGLGEEVTPVPGRRPPPLELWLGLPGVRPGELVAATLDGDAVRLELALERDGVLERRVVLVHGGVAPPAASPPLPPGEGAFPPLPPGEGARRAGEGAPPPPPASAAPAARLVAFGTAALITGVVGTLLGGVLGWLAFAPH